VIVMGHAKADGILFEGCALPYFSSLLIEADGAIPVYKLEKQQAC